MIGKKSFAINIDFYCEEKWLESNEYLNQNFRRKWIFAMEKNLVVISSFRFSTLSLLNLFLLSTWRKSVFHPRNLIKFSIKSYSVSTFRIQQNIYLFTQRWINRQISKKFYVFKEYCCDLLFFIRRKTSQKFSSDFSPVRFVLHFEHD